MAGAQCCENPPALDSGSGIGAVVDDFGGLKAYTAGSLDSKIAIVLISDIFGYEAPNLRKLADKVSAAGYYVVVPDFFYGDPFVPNTVPLQEWLQPHKPEKGFEDAKPLIAALREKGASAIGAAGMCWGAKVVAELSKTGAINTGVMLHPSFVTVDDIKETKTSICVLGAEIDQMSPPELVNQFKEVLSTKFEVDNFVKIFPGVSHGWTVRYDVNDEAAVKKAEEAHEDMMGWFKKHLKP